jgi:hypothetical protein
MQVSVTPREGRIVVEISDAKGASSFELDRHHAFALMVSIAQAVNALPHNPTEPLSSQKAVLKAKHPSFQVGIAQDGDVVLAIQPVPFPSIEFEFDAEMLGKLIADLRKAANLPRQEAGKPN